MDHTPKPHHGLGDTVLSTLSLVVVAWLILSPSDDARRDDESGWGRA